jgi:hypothetical protein
VTADTSPSMSTAAFASWMRRRGLIDEHAAPLLAAHPSEVTRWRNGTRPVPRRVARIVELLDTIDAERTTACAE